MKCPVCDGTDIIKKYEKEYIKFECNNGHSWCQKYSNEEPYIRPDYRQRKIEDIFFAEEEKIYRKIIREIEQNKDFYLLAEPLEKAEALITNCQINKEDLFRIMKKINDFQDDLQYK